MSRRGAIVTSASVTFPYAEDLLGHRGPEGVSSASADGHPSPQRFEE
jgi:hypothetical protein